MRRTPAKSRALVLVALFGAAATALLSSCGGNSSAMVPIDPSKGRVPVAEVAELEIRAGGIDRFAICPPPGDLGQPWFPSPGAWTAPPVAPSGSGSASPEPVDQDFITRTKDRTATELAIEATQRDFRACYRRGLVHDPAQDGRVAVVLRIGADGHVARVEELAACEISVESIACMEAAASRLRFPPPSGGSDTVLIPAVFTSRDGVRRSKGNANESYTASAYIVLESARADFHACEEHARKDHRPVQAAGTFTLSLGADGQVLRAHVDPWVGEKSVLACAAHALEKLRFSAPPDGNGFVIARLNFNPRQGSR